MRDLERTINRVKLQMSAGCPTQDIRHTLQEGGTDPETIYWAIRAAHFEIAYTQKNREPNPKVKTEK